MIVRVAEQFGCPPSDLYHVSIGELLTWNRRLSGDDASERKISRIWSAWRKHQAAGGDVDTFTF